MPRPTADGSPFRVRCRGTRVARLTDGATSKITGGAALHRLALARERRDYRALAETTFGEATAVANNDPTRVLFASTGRSTDDKNAHG